MNTLTPKENQMLKFPGIIFTCILVMSLALHAQSARILLDGIFSDWTAIPPLHSDPIGDPLGGDIDFQRLWAANDENYLFIRIEVGAEINLQDFNEVALFLDTDDNPSTGISVEGIGAELEWNFGNRNGFFAANGSTYPIFHDDIGVVTAPTITSDDFEIALRRDAQPVGQIPLFSGQDIRIVFKNQVSGGDVLPNASGGVSYTFSNTPLTPLGAIPIAQKNSNTIRFLSYNVLNDGLFDPPRVPYFTRLLQAIQPAIIGFVEIYNHTASQTVSQVENILPSGAQQQWYASKVAPDVIAVSRYPIQNTFAIEGSTPSSNNGAFLIDLRPQFDSDLLLVVAHPPAGSNNTGRQYEIDAIMAFIRDAKAAGGVLTLMPNTPIMIIGDLNLVGYAQQLTTLLSGQIVNTGQFGQPFIPDWDGTDFSDLLPRCVNLPMYFTWYSDFSSFSPGRLDFMIYSDSVIESLQQFILFTASLPPDTLSAYGLMAEDATSASDHLPVVGDFVVQNSLGSETQANAVPQSFELERNYPNPFNPETNIGFRLPAGVSQAGISDGSTSLTTGFGFVELKIYDIMGREVKTLVKDQLAPGSYEVQWDGQDDAGEAVASGIYIYRLKISSPGAGTGAVILSKKMALIR
jgi:hypothetical protein